MKTKVTLQQAHEYLDSLLVFGIKLGLENMKALLCLLEYPEKGLKFIHLAGTNGKGSTGALLATALKKGSYRTGFYSSPFLKDFCERWRVNGLPVSDEVFCEALAEIIEIEDELVNITGVRPTYFEVLTAVAILIFKKQACDFIIWETGMGGRLDATNAVDPIVTAITNVSADHQQFLGDSLTAIAGEKAGIIKAGIPFIGGDLDGEVLDVVKQAVKETGAPAQFKNENWFIQERQNFDGGKCLPGSKIIIKSGADEFEAMTSLAGLHQADNLALAVMVLRQLSSDGYIDNLSDVLNGTAAAIWPGRLHELPDGMLCDGAHNPAGISSLVNTLQEAHPNRKWHITTGMLADKDWRSNLEILFPIMKSIIFVPVANPRTLKPQEAVDFIQSHGFEARACSDLQEALEVDQGKENRLCLGSLYLIGELLSLVYKDEALPLDV